MWGVGLQGEFDLDAGDFVGAFVVHLAGAGAGGVALLGLRIVDLQGGGVDFRAGGGRLGRRADIRVWLWCGGGG